MQNEIIQTRLLGLISLLSNTAMVVFNAVLGMYLFVGKLEADNTWDAGRMGQ